MIRPMLSYGVTEDLQVSASLPVPLETDSSVPGARAFTRMPASRDIEMMLGWRVQRRGTGVGARQETTIWLAADVPTDASRDGLETAPSLFGSVVTGYASRSIYFWLGGALERSLSSGSPNERAGDGIRSQPANRPSGSKALEQRDVFSNRIDVDLHAFVRRHS